MSIQIRFILETVNAPEYDCSAHNSSEWTELHGKRRVMLGIWSIVFATVCQILYLPALRVFHKERRLTSYKIMLILILADIGGLICMGSLFGYSMIRGMVFCSDTTLAWIMGCGQFCCWYTSSCNCILLVCNRIGELMERSWIFQATFKAVQGKRSSLLILIILSYAVIGMFFTRPCLPNSVYQTIAFDPFIPGHTSDEYPNRLVIFHNCTVAISIPSLYIVLCAAMHSNSIFTQASLICFVNATAATLWVLPMFILLPKIFFVAGTIIVQLVHGLPSIIYLLLNRSVRTELLRMAGRSPPTSMVNNVFTSAHNHTVTSVATRFS